MKKTLFSAFIVFSLIFSSSEVAMAVIPKPKPRPQEQKTQVNSEVDLDAAFKKLQDQYPHLKLPASADVKWVDPTGRGAEADIAKSLGRPIPEEEYDDDENAPTPEELREIQKAQYWLDVKEDLTLRAVDQKALALVQDFAKAKDVVPPTQGSNGAVAYTYGNMIPKVVCRPNRITDIALQPGEKVNAVHAGDTTRWQISPAKSGAGAGEVVHLVVKPLMPDISTNLLVMTDRRTYNLDLVSSATNFIPAIRFDYPQDTMAAWDTFIATNRSKQEKDLELTPSYAMSAESLFFGYKVVDKKGKGVPWKPVRVFDDGTKTYIQLPEKYKALEAPVVLFYEGKKQKIVNYRVKGAFYIVDRIMTSKAVLIAGQMRVVIVRGKESGQ